jgi:putative endonuclease
VTVKLTPYKKGVDLETRARLFLEKKGLKFLAKNFRSRVGEIDLIMENADTIVFVEIRGRQKNNYGTAAETIDFKKQQKIIRTAENYLSQFSFLEKNLRFDVVEFFGPGFNKINWIKDAFWVE